MGKLSQGKTVFREENKKTLKKVKKLLKSAKKRLTKVVVCGIIDRLTTARE